MSRKILIKNFGPVKTAEVDLDKNFQIFIGEQASGKSTIGKAVYFCRKIRDYTLDFLLEDDQFMLNHQNEYFTNYLKYLTILFLLFMSRIISVWANPASAKTADTCCPRASLISASPIPSGARNFSDNEAIAL